MVGLFSHPKRKLRKLVHDGDYAEAIEFGKSIESKHAKDTDFLFIMGSIFYILEDGKNALSYFDRVLQINDNDTEALFLSANIHYHLNNLEIVKQNCEKVLRIDSEHKGAKELLEKSET